jgi:hypothetical protein
MPPKRETPWTIFVKDWAKGAGVSYPCASTDPRCRADYEAWKAKNGMKATRPRKAPGEPKRKYVRKDPNAPVVPKRKYVRKVKVDAGARAPATGVATGTTKKMGKIAAPVATGTTMKMRKIAAAKASTKADKTWVDDWAKSIGASFEAKPKRKYVRKPKPPAGDTTLAMRNPALAGRLALRAMLPNIS